MEESKNWKSEFAHSFRNLKDLYHFLEWDLPSSLLEVAGRYPIFIPKSLAEKIKNEGPDGVLGREFLPHELELKGNGLVDPIGDKEYFKAPQIIHRYKSRVLFTPTTICPVHCRYCFRKNELNADDEVFQKDFSETLKYLKDHPEISEIIFTGGDPLTLSNERLEFCLNAFSAIPAIKDIRFHTRYPVILPKRIDEGFLKLLSDSIQKFRTISIAVHANHVKEFDSENRSAITSLRQTGVQLLSQSVLLKSVNDRKEDLLDLMNEFLHLKIRPYYLHHPDQAKGAMHFYIPLIHGRELYLSLRQELPGWALPHYVIDIPGGHGKVQAFNPESTSFSGQLLSREGSLIEVEEPDFIV